MIGNGENVKIVVCLKCVLNVYICSLTMMMHKVHGERKIRVIG